MDQLLRVLQALPEKLRNAALFLPEVSCTLLNRFRELCSSSKAFEGHNIKGYPTYLIRFFEALQDMSILSCLTKVDRIYIVLQRDGDMFTRKTSFENIRDRLTFLHALLDPANEGGLTEHQEIYLLICAYLGIHRRCELKIPGYETPTSTAWTGDSLGCKTSTTTEIAMPSFTARQIEDAYESYKQDRSTVDKNFWIRKCSLQRKNIARDIDIRDREFYSKVAFVRFFIAAKLPDEVGSFDGIGVSLQNDTDIVRKFNNAHRLICEGATLPDEEDLLEKDPAVGKGDTGD